MHPMAIFITITGAHGHFRYTLVRSYVHIFLPSTELARRAGGRRGRSGDSAVAIVTVSVKVSVKVTVKWQW